MAGNTQTDSHGTRRCEDCAEHSGIVAELNAGTKIMERLESSIESLRTDFSSHVKIQTARMITILLLVISTLLTGFVSIYVGSIKNNQYQEMASKQETTKILKEIVGILKESQK